MRNTILHDFKEIAIQFGILNKEIKKVKPNRIRMLAYINNILKKYNELYKDIKEAIDEKDKPIKY